MRVGTTMMLMAILAMPLQAQRQGRTRGPAQGSVIDGRGDTRDAPADYILQLRERLELSEDQVEGIKEAQRADREVRDALRLETRELRDRLRDEEITREEFRETMEGRRRQDTDGLTTYRRSLEDILTDDQRSRMRELRRQTSGGRGQAARGRSQLSRGGRAQQGRPGATGGRGMRRSGGAGGFGPPGSYGRQRGYGPGRPLR